MLPIDIDLNKKYLLAVSGGIDSMVMCDVFLKKKISFAVAHCNFQLRAGESDGDEALVNNWCLENNIPLFVQRFDTLTFAEQQKLSIQEAARELRYKFFYEQIAKEGFDLIVTAHHSDDNLETVLFHFFRGSGIQGLTGIPAENNGIIRPFLNSSKSELMDYAQTNKIAYRDDSSNQKNDYTRNKLRNVIIPQLEEIFPSFKNSLAKNIERFVEINQLYTRQVEIHRNKLVEQRGKDFYIPVRKLKNITPLHTLLYELLKPFGFNADQASQALRMMESMPGRVMDSNSHRLLKDRNFFIISEKNTAASDIIIVEKETGSVTTADFELEFKTIPKDKFQPDVAGTICQADAGELVFPLLLRKWRQGDYMYPLGMKKKKKIARILIDMKIPMQKKEMTWVIESEKKIVWLTGLKIDERFKVKASTNEILVINLKNIQ